MSGKALEIKCKSMEKLKKILAIFGNENETL